VPFGLIVGVARHPHPTLSPFKSAAAPTSLAIPQAQTHRARLPLGSTFATIHAPNVWPPARSSVSGLLIGKAMTTHQVCSPIAHTRDLRLCPRIIFAPLRRRSTPIPTPLRYSAGRPFLESGSDTTDRPTLALSLIPRGALIAKIAP
jgi:hypothetical protein